MIGKFKKNGFMLLEVIVATVLCAVVGLGVYRVLVSGINIYNFASSYKTNSDATIFLDKLSFDLANCSALGKNSFSGTEHKISFLIHDANIFSSSLENSETLELGAIYTVEYVFDLNAKTIMRNVYRFGDTKKVSSKNVLKAVDNVSFSFFAPQTNSLEYEELATITQMPKALKILLEMSSQREGIRRLQKVVHVPLVM